MGNCGLVEVSTQLQDNNFILTVKDTGCGIENDKISAVLKRGVSLHKPQGSGLGLSDAYEKAKEWGGELEIKSTVGVGTTVAIKLPVSSKI